MTLTAVEHEDGDVLLAEATFIGPLLDGAVPTVSLATATAVWRLLKRRQERKSGVREVAERKHRTEHEEVAALRTMSDRLMLFLVGRPASGGLPAVPGFLDEWSEFKQEVSDRFSELGGNVASLSGTVASLEAEWRPNGGSSSYDRLRRIERQVSDDPTDP